ncbi:Endoribonuclease L-PSP/chorismate mutase-like protein [Pseudomassariella vexata]|uniref:Endoribonuclease L-PSP/chorismate mutase-like protein n=1 Tax=Pseudomassariella vexata TaxID=1141098 RepID=A0A1Y2E7H5_9PEZI|nr:Endoribonuclease L-PSP/chorismate mutase-like protein [Pseudomassariella vexata]ORY67523.1 Endoribonuclease L-PSP/chorismate mutase-like protein [Pseudomassariella vexata]
MSRQLISNEEFPQRPHNCPAVTVPGLVFCSGQIGKGEIKQATTTALSNLKKVLELSGSSIEKVVKFNVYLQDMKDFDTMNEAYIAFLPPNPPARTCIQAGCLPGGAVVEIECIAMAGTESAKL